MPRGKIVMLRRFLEGKLPLDEAAASEFWYRCTTCKACETSCPVGVQIVDLVVEARRLLLEDGRVPGTAAAALRSIYLNGNPWRRPADERSAWASGLNVRELKEGEQAETLLYVGCLASYDPRGQRVARAFSEILTIAGVDFAILGARECCCGREVHNLGEEGLFDWLVAKNRELFQRHGVQRLITLSPHCYDAFKNLYPAFAEVWHYTQFLQALGEEGRLRLGPAAFGRVTYHDPCYLSRRNGIVGAPRQVLRQMPGLELLELVPGDVENLCCEGGGGRMWLEAPRGGRSLAAELASCAVKSGAEALAVACPFCLTNLEGVFQTADGGPPLPVLDVAELLRQCL